METYTIPDSYRQFFIAQNLQGRNGAAPGTKSWASASRRYKEWWILLLCCFGLPQNQILSE